MKVGVLGNRNKVKNIQTIYEIVEHIQSLGYTTQLFEDPKDIQGVDVVIVLGGDGAILHAAMSAAKNGVKIIGINYGTLGFLTEYEKEERECIGELLKQVQENTCRILKRSVLQVDIAGQTYYALNEVVLHRHCGLTNNQAQLVSIKVHSQDGQDILSGDGVIICTPTGSTAYSLSAGGAILMPEVPVFMLTPISAFSMRARPIVFSNTEEVALQVTKGTASVATDGQTIVVLPENATIFVKKAPFTADFPVRKNVDFFAKVHSKLNE